MIPIVPKPEPANFDKRVRKPGIIWLQNNGIVLDQAPPDPAKLPTYWSRTQRELWEAYDGVCAYLCIYIPWGMGAHSTDHFVPKSKDAGQAYEWANYRLCCMSMNRHKNNFNDVVDPFQIQPDTFILNLASGKVSPHPHLTPDLYEKVIQTIDRLKLNDPENQKMRAEHYTYYLKEEYSDTYLKKNSPFVWYEAQRQGLL